MTTPPRPGIAPGAPSPPARRPARRALLRGAGLLAGGWAAAGAGCALPWSQGPLGQGPGGEVSLVYGSEGNIVALSVDGRTRRQLTRVAAGEAARDPAWSPDGKRIAYSLMGAFPTPTRDGVMAMPAADVWIMDASGADPRVVVAHEGPGVRYESPVWAPDGASLYVSQVVPTLEYGVLRDRVAGVLRVPLDGSAAQRRLVIPEGTVPGVSADGGRLVCLLFREDGRPSLAVADADGGHLTTLVPWESLPVMMAPPRFSPDGRRIVFTAFLEDESTPPGQPTSQRRSLEEGLRGAFSPRPALAHGTPTDLFVVGSDGAGLRRMTTLGAGEAAGVWSPDGAKLAVLTHDSFFVAETDGRNPVRIEARGGLGAVDWRR